MVTAFSCCIRLSDRATVLRLMVATVLSGMSWFCGRGNHEADRKIIRARERRRHDREHLDTGNRAQFCLDLRQVGLGRSFANAPRLQNHPAEAVIRKGKLKGEPRVRDVLKDLPG